MIRHRRVRRFFKPWAFKCSCGWPYYPCFDVKPIGVVPRWTNERTDAYPLTQFRLTPGQNYRGSYGTLINKRSRRS